MDLAENDQFNISGKTNKRYFNKSDWRNEKIAL